MVYKDAFAALCTLVSVIAVCGCESNRKEAELATKEVVGPLSVLGVAKNYPFLGFDDYYAFGGSDTGESLTKDFVLMDTKEISKLYDYLTNKPGWKRLVESVRRDSIKIAREYTSGMAMLVQAVPFRPSLPYDYSCCAFFNDSTGMIYWCPLDSNAINVSVMPYKVVSSIKAIRRQKARSVMDGGTPGPNIAFISIVDSDEAYSWVAGISSQYGSLSPSNPAKLSTKELLDRTNVYKMIWDIINASDSTLPQGAGPQKQ